MFCNFNERVLENIVKIQKMKAALNKDVFMQFILNLHTPVEDLRNISKRG